MFDEPSVSSNSVSEKVGTPFKMQIKPESSSDLQIS